MISWDYVNEEGKTIHLFFQETPKNKEFISRLPMSKEDEYGFFTEEEKRHFRNYKLRITTFTVPMCVQDRMNIFNKIQFGVPIKNSDMLRNHHECKTISFLIDNDCEQQMLDVFFPHCTKDAEQYRIHWLVRLYLLFVCYKNGTTNQEIFTECFVIRDNDISQRIIDSELDPKKLD
jgi:hypothetical protein